MATASKSLDAIRIATIGHDDQLNKLVQLAISTGRYQLVAEFDRLDSSDDNSAPASRWEELLSESVCDLVIVSELPASESHQEHRAEQLRRLVASQIPIVAIHPVCDMLLAYELEMIRSDTDAVIFPFVPLANHPALGELRAVATSAEPRIGSLEQWSWERFEPESARTKELVWRRLAQDVLVYRELVGEIKTVSASGAPSDCELSNLSVHLTSGEESPVAKWAIGPVRDRQGSELLAVGTDHVAGVWIDDQGEIEAKGALTETPFENEAADATALRFLEEVAASLQDGKAWTGISWTSVCRSLEVIDGVERSIKRKRTIELYHEQITEHDTFKSMMAAGGCGLLLLVLGLLFVVGVVEGLRLPFRNMFLWRLWPIVLAATLSLFLAMQLLQFVYTKERQQ